MNAFDEVNQFFDRAPDRLGLDDGTRELLKKPWRELTVSVPVRMDDGTIKVFGGYRIQHNAARGPYKGGTRFHPAADVNEVRALASLSESERNRMTRRYTANIHHLLGVNRDIPAPDMGTDSQTMAWMMDAYGAIQGYTPGIVTGKPIELGGSVGRDAAPGRGAVYVMSEAARELGLTIGGARVVIQGFGQVGRAHSSRDGLQGRRSKRNRRLNIQSARPRHPASRRTPPERLPRRRISRRRHRHQCGVA